MQNPEMELQGMGNIAQSGSEYLTIMHLMVRWDQRTMKKIGQY